MSIPSEIREQLGDVEPDAHAQLSAGITSPMGETHFVAAGGRLHVFTRESLTGGLERVKLDPEHAPKLEKGGFADTLHIALENGEVYQMNVGSFERDRVTAVLDASSQGKGHDAEPPDPAAGPAASSAERLPRAPMESPWADPLTGFGDSAKRKEFGTGPSGDAPRDHGDYASPGDAGYAAERSADYAAERSRGYAVERSEDYSTEGGKGYAPERSTGYAAERSEDYGASGGDTRASTGAAVFRSNNPGCFGCVLQVVMFAGGIAAMWYLHPPALRTAAEFLDFAPPEPGGAGWTVTRIVALIIGAYAGAKLAGLISRVAKRQMWGGAVLFKENVMIVFGPRGRWQKRFDLGQGLDWECRWFTANENADRESKRHYHAAVDIRQGGVSALFKTTTHAKQINFHAKEMTYTQLEEIPGGEGAITFDDKTLRKVIRRIAEHKGWEA